MKKILVFFAIVSLFAGARLQAAPVSPERALRIAQQLLGGASTKAADGLRIVWDGEAAATKAAEPAFYVVARDGGGFVIIAGDDRAFPVLAISERNEFPVEGMPANVRWWMERMKADVRATKVASPEAQDLWMRLEGETKATTAAVTGEVTGKVEKLTPEWNQGNSDKTKFGQEVFNAKCPLDLDGETRSVTGCVATAMSELLTYQSGQAGVTMPSSATGTVGGYSVGSGFVRPDEYNLGVTYDWTNLRTLTNTTAIQTVVDASKESNPAATALLNNLAQLMLDMGAMMQASYSKDGTGAVTSNIPAKLVTHMDFNKGAYYDEAANYSARQWVNKLKSEIDRRPLIYNGRDPEHGGHAFIFDGYGTYEGATVFHVNFGWGGGANGYYYHTNLDTGGNGNYVQNCGAIFDLYPDPDSTYPVKLAWGSYSSYQGLQAESAIAAGEDFTIKFCIDNRGNSAYSGSVKFVLEDKAGTQKSVLAQIDGISIGAGPSTYTYYYGVGPFNIPTLVFGDRIVAYYTTVNASTWEAVPTLLNGSVVPEIPVLPRAFIATAASYSNGDWFELKLKNQDYLYAGTRWTFTPPAGAPVTVPQSDIEFQLNQAGTWKISAEVKATVDGATIETIVAYVTVN